MAKKLLDNKLLYVILSVILAFSLWYYVTALEGDARQDTISNIPVTFVGEDVLLEKGLIITSEVPRVNIKFGASATTWLNLNRDAVTLTIDVSGVSQPGTHTLAYEVSYSGVSRSNVTVIDQNPVNVSFTVERYETRSVEIRGEFTGTLASDDYTIAMEPFEFLPETLSVSGRMSDVDQIAYALVTIDSKGLTDTVQGDFPYQLIGANGEPLDLTNLAVECSTELISTVFHVNRIAEIPLTVTFVDGGGATLEENVDWGMSVDSIRVSGENADMESLVARGSLSVATINLASLTEEVNTVTCTIPLAEELTIMDGITEVDITVTIKNLSTKTVEVTEFTTQNEPEGFEATITGPRSLNVMVRGTAEEVEQVSAANLRVVADLTDINTASGQYTVNAMIFFDGPSGAGVIGSDYPLVVRLTEK